MDKDNSQEDDPLYDEVAAGIFLGGDGNPISTRTLQRWRQTGKGPAFCKMGGLIRYRKKRHLEAFQEQCERSSTSEAA